MQRPKEWDKYEAAVLLDAYLKTLIPGTPYSKIIDDTSNKLRMIAQNNGLVIDDIYRNTNGIKLQMYRMESAYLGYKKSLPTSKLFTDVVRVYRENKKAYDMWLSEANNMVNGTMDMRTQFREWLEKTTPKARPDFLCQMLTIGEEFCKKTNFKDILV